MNKQVLLVVASKGYHPKEYGETRLELEQAGFTVVVASDMPGKATVMPGGARAGLPRYVAMMEEFPAFAECVVDCALESVEPQEYQGMFVVGGAGAMELLDTPLVHQLLQRFVELGKPVGAICISPRILAKAGVLAGKRATGWNEDNGRDAVFAQYGVVPSSEHVVHDGAVVTADGPVAAQGFGKEIVQILTQACTKRMQTSCCALA